MPLMFQEFNSLSRTCPLHCQTTVWFSECIHMRAVCHTCKILIISSENKTPFNTYVMIESVSHMYLKTSYRYNFPYRVWTSNTFLQTHRISNNDCKHMSTVWLYFIKIHFWGNRQQMASVCLQLSSDQFMLGSGFSEQDVSCWMYN